MAELTIRPPKQVEAEAVTDLVVACDVAEYGAPDFELDDLLVEWRRPDFDLEADAWVAEAPGGSIVGYAMVHRGEYADVYVHPEHRGRGLGSRLLALTEERAAQQAPAGGSVLLGQVVSSGDQDARAILERAGYEPVRRYWRMAIELDGPPPPPAWPPGVSVRTFEQGRDDRAVHALVQESFGDNERHTPQTFEEWESFMIEREAFEPSLWYLAVDEQDAIVGAVLCPAYEDEGWIRQVAVARDWRRRGVGTALLRQALAEFHRRGRREVALVVDSWNRTGAKEMYERAGMHVTREYARYEKEIPAAS